VNDRLNPLSTDLKQVAHDIFDFALAECSIERAFDRRLQFIADPQGPAIVVDDSATIPLSPLKHVRIIAAGKAAVPMLASLLRRLTLPSPCDIQGVLITPNPPPNLLPTLQYFAGGHPLPNQASFAGAAAALTLLRDVADSPDTLCIFLISGGASSMMELPLDPTITVDDTASFHQALVHSGATIVEMNCIRKHFSAVKGGRLARAAGRARKLTFLVSDVRPDHLDALGSGPTIPDPTTVAQCRAVLEKYNLLRTFPTSVQRFFQSPDLPETPKPGQIVSPAFNLIDSDNLAEIAQSRAAYLGFHAIVDNTCDDWSYDAAADYLLERIRRLRLDHRKVCIISTGEVTVKIPQSTPHPSSDRNSPTAPIALGGRNQHLALYLLTQLRTSDSPIAVLSAGTDGIDGNSNAAGAVVDQSTLDGNLPVTGGIHRSHSTQPSRRAGALEALQQFNSSTWLTQAGATIITGPTGHNLRDLRILLADRT
jgi:glycerate 2-kinase